ncbi:MAG: D-alanine--D-alanine ligase [Clostridia bacterium]|nr:D-alanine--D-alanine ligase [Clostridia bacterium]MBQ8339600.1 D-alanine--D-alanine ligase [Clostridia bacterium]
MEIIILFGGVSAERAVSLTSGKRVAAALAREGHEITLFDYRFGGFSEDLLQTCRRADAVFLALHGGAGEDGRLQAELERRGIYHYTGSAPEASRLAMDKAAAKACVAAAGVPVASGVVWQPGEPLPPLAFPAVLKPLSGGSSVGLILAENATRLATFSPMEPMLCEAYLPGAEYTVGVLRGRALPVVEICPQSGRYDYAAKYTEGATLELCPAPMPPQAAEALQQTALLAFEALGLRDYARLDFKCDGSGRPYFLEANTLPGMTGTSLLPLAAATAGIPFPALVLEICGMAAARKRT